jgi:AraC-like DNA-binding protein
MNRSLPERLSFNTDGLPERDRFAAFYEGLFRHVVGLDMMERGAGPFGGALDICLLGGIVVADISTTAADLVRRASHTRDGDDAFVVQFWRGGSGALQQNGRESPVTVGKGLLIDNARPATIRCDVASAFLALTIPRSKLLALAPGVAGDGGKLEDNPALWLLSEYLGGIAASDLGDVSTSRLIADHIVDLAAYALRGESDLFVERRGVREARRAQILRAIERSSRNPGLSADLVARSLGITPRYVHLLLEETGQSFGHHVLQRRLERAARLLRNPAWSNRRVADIAAAAGFSDLSYFNRVFRRRFGATPTDIREAARPHAVTAQA